MTKTQELREPCPFCGSADPVFANFREHPYSSGLSRWHVTCDKCGAEGPEAQTEAAAITAWNTRARSQS